MSDDDLEKQKAKYIPKTVLLLKNLTQLIKSLLVSIYLTGLTDLESTLFIGKVIRSFKPTLVSYLLHLHSGQTILVY